MLGPAMTLKAAAKGSGSDLAVDVAGSSAAVDADVGLRYTPAAVETARVGTISAQTRGLAALAPGAFTETPEAGGGTLAVDQWPRADLKLESLRIPLAGGAPDWAGAAARLTLKAGEASARLAVEEGGASRVVAVKFRPLTAVLETGRLADGVRLTASNAVEIDGHEAGDLAVDLAAKNLVVAGRTGGSTIDPARAMFDGTAALTGFDTRAAQPFVQRLGVRLPQDVGPQVDARLTVAGRIDPASALPETSVDVRISGRVMTASAQIALENGRASTSGGGVVVESKNVGPLLMRLAPKSGLRIEGPMPLSVALTEAHADVQRVLGSPGPAGKPGAKPPAAKGPDLRGAGGTLTIGVGPVSGRAPLEAGGEARPFRVDATTLTVDTSNIAHWVNIRAKVAGDIDGASAGTLDVSLAVLGLLDESGALRAVPAGPLRGRVAGQGVPTALAQSLVPGLTAARLDLPADLGPSVDLSIAAKPDEGTAPVATVVDFTIKSQRLGAEGSAVMDAGAVRAGSSPVTVTLQSPGPLIARWLPAGSSGAPGGTAVLTLAEFVVPLGADPLRATGRAQLKLNGVALTPPGGPPVQIASAALSADAAGPGPVKVGLAGSFQQGDQPFTAKGDLTLAGLIAPGPDGRKLDLAGLRPTGAVNFNDVPASILAMAGAAAPGGDGKQGGGDLVSLVRGAAGPKVSIGLTFADAPGTAGTDAKITAGAAGAHLHLAARVTPGDITLQDSTGDFLLSTESIAAILDRFAPESEARPALKAPVRLNFTIAGARAPRGPDGMPNLGAASPLTWSATVPGRLEIENLGAFVAVADGDAPKGFGGLAMSGTVPLAALASGGSGDLKAAITADVLGGLAGAAQRLEGDLAAHLEGGSPSGPVSAGLRVRGFDTRWADAVSGKAGMVSGLLGAVADVDAKFDARFAPASDTDGSAQLHDGTATLSVASPTFSMSAPATVVIHPDRYELSKPTVVRATVGPAWADAFLLGNVEAADGPPEPHWGRFTTPTDVTLTLNQLVIAQGEGPLKPGVFGARGAIEAPKISMVMGDGPAEFVGLRIDASGGDKPGVIGFSMRMAEAGTEGAAPNAGGGGPPAPGGVRFAGGLYNVCDEAGRLTADAAQITATGQAPGFRTAVLDAMAGRDGLLTELLGPRVTLDVALGGFGRESGKIDVNAVSPRASASMKGRVRHGVLVASEPVKAELKEVTPELGARLSSGLPLIGTFEKRPEDGPALLTATGLTLPLNHDLTELNADLLFDFGRARFQTSGAFSSILKAVGAQGAGEVGRKLEPLNIAVRKGVISYERYTLPLGEFSVQTQGTVDLVSRQVDLVTFIPLGALSDEAAGVFNTGLGKLLGGAVPTLERATMVPWRTRGPMDNPKTTPDMGLFFQKAGRSLLSPGSDLLQKLGDILGGKK
jgi:hypothetical protein